MAVYTELSDDQIDAFVARYPIGPVLSCKGIAEGVENTNYLLMTETGPYILTLYEKRVNPLDLPFFLQLLEHLAGKGIACPLPVSDHDGLALSSVGGKPAAIVTFLQGQWPRHIEPFHCAALGFALGEMHIAGADFTLTRANDLGQPQWRPLYDRCRGDVEAVLPGAATRIEADLAEFETGWITDLPRGYIHADLFPDNVFFQGDRLSGLIDFYFACKDSLAYDLAVCINAWAFDDGHRLVPERVGELIRNYHTVRPLADREIAALPMLARGASMRFLLTRLYDWINTPGGAQVKRKDPTDYLARLDQLRAIADPADLGIDL